MNRNILRLRDLTERRFPHNRYGFIFHPDEWGPVYQLFRFLRACRLVIPQRYYDVLFGYYFSTFKSEIAAHEIYSVEEWKYRGEMVLVFLTVDIVEKIIDNKLDLKWIAFIHNDLIGSPYLDLFRRITSRLKELNLIY